MAATTFFPLVVQSIIQLPQMVGDELDEATRERMQQRAEMLSREMTRLLQELEQSSQEQSGFAGEPCSLLPCSSGSSGRLLESWSCSSGSPGGSGKEAVSQPASSDREQVEGEEEGNDDVNDLGRLFEEHIQRPVQNLATECQEVKFLVDHFILAFRELLLNSFFPVLQPAIGVGSAFEGWSPHEEDIIYRLLVPLNPLRGHVFHLELDTTGEMPARNFCIHVELVCTCLNEQLAGEMLCFLHHPEEELRRNQNSSLLSTLCTSSYLDVQKTALWFQNSVKDAWVVLPQSCKYRLMVLPSSRSCKFQVTNGNNGSLCIEVMFGVRQGNSDIFMSSQTRETIFTPSTTWPESYAVAEVNFFRHVARHAPHDSFHLKCLQLCTRILVCTGFSTYTVKTAVMHLLTTISLSHWGRRDFLLRMLDIMRYLRCCLEQKRLNHFFFGNENVPEEIILPLAFKTAKPLNLFQHLAQDPAAHAEALREFMELRDLVTRLLIFGR